MGIRFHREWGGRKIRVQTMPARVLALDKRDGYLWAFCEDGMYYRAWTTK